MDASALSAAIAHLRAVEVELGLFAWQEKNLTCEGHSWYIASADALAHATHRIDGIRVLARWWFPWQRYAWVVGDSDTRYANESLAQRELRLTNQGLALVGLPPVALRRVTVDVHTGSEVAA